MIILADLDNTLLDRHGAFRSWATAFLDDVDQPADLDWLLRRDADGYRPRVEVAHSLRDRYHLSDTVEHLVDRLLSELVALTVPYPNVVSRLQLLRQAGAEVVVVTNGTTRQQTAKMARTGLLELVTGVVISESVGVKKPHPQIFQAALQVARHTGDGAPPWMIGDHILADMGGAHALGLATGWVSHGKTWTESWQPTLAAERTADILEHLLTLTLRATRRSGDDR